LVEELCTLYNRRWNEDNGIFIQGGPALPEGPGLGAPPQQQPGGSVAPKTIEELGAVNPEFRLSQPYDRPPPVQQPDNNQYVSIDGGIPTNPMSQIPMMENPQREHNTMPSMEMTPDFAAYQNYFRQMYNPATGSDQLPGQWAQLTPEQKAQYSATTPGPVAPEGPISNTLMGTQGQNWFNNFTPQG
jgi:hypothetical protein